MKHDLTRLWAPAFVLLLSLFLTGVATQYVAASIEARDELRFKAAAEAARYDISERMGAYVTLLRGIAGLFAASEEVTRDDFREYVERLELSANYPGIQGIGYSQRIPAAQKPAVEAAMRRHFPNFEIRPPATRPEYHSIVYLEPQDRRNRVAIGFDMYSNPLRREAMEKARDTGNPTASGPVTLVQEIEGPKQPGLLVYVPVYSGTTPPATVAERRRRLRGYAYSPYRAADLLNGILSVQASRLIDVSVYDGPTAAPERLLYSSRRSPARHRPQFVAPGEVEIAGRPWTLRFSSNPRFEAESQRGLVPFVAAGGVFVSLLLFGVTWAQARARAEAERATETLRRSEEALRDAGRQKDEFLAMLGHELRNPLAAIRNSLEVMRLRGVADPLLRADIELAERQVRTQSRLVDDLLDVSRVTSGKIILQEEVLDLRKVVRHAWETVETGAGAGEHRMELSLPPQPVVVHGDPVRLEQVTVNLLTNAVKYTPAGGSISLTLQTEPAPPGAPGTAVIRVRDTGIGIRPELLNCIFETFTQAETSLDRSRGGLGLGLTLVRALVRLHGGAVTARSEGPGKGSEFEVRLPLAEEGATLPSDPRPSATSLVASDAEPAGAGALRVLVVEDNSDARETLCDLLELWGHQVEAAEDGARGVEAILTRTPDVALVDIGLPGLDGYEVARQVRTRRPQDGPRLIALTGYGQPEDRALALGAGFDAHLVKPVDLEQLARMLAER